MTPEIVSPASPEAGVLRIALCIPSAGEWKSATGLAVAKLVQHFERGRGGEIEVFAVKGFMVPEQRSRCVAEAWRWNATHVLWVDSDMCFPPDALLRLLHHGKAVVGVNYPRKMFPPIPTAYVDNAVETGALYTTDEKSGLEEVKHCGFGLLLCEIGVFDRLAEDLPLFAFEPQPPYFTRFCTEDVYFCRKLKKHGITVYIDHDLSREVTHVGDVAFTNDMALAGMAEVRGRVSRLQVPAELTHQAQDLLKEAAQ
jgi:hypothetical protein